MESSEGQNEKQIMLTFSHGNGKKILQVDSPHFSEEKSTKTM